MSETTIKYFTDDEMEAIFFTLRRNRLEAVTDYQHRVAVRNEALFRLLRYTGMRVSESLALTINDYNDLNMEIHCRRLKHGKNNTLRIIDDQVLESFKRHIKENKPRDFIFTDLKDTGITTGKPLSRKTADKIFKVICQAANLYDESKWHCHSLRHTCAIKLAEEGFDIKELQYWLGHRSVTNTMVYFEFTSKQQDTMYKKLKQRRSRI